MTHSGRVLPSVLLVLAACAVIAVAAHGIRLVLPPLELGSGARLFVRVAGGLAVAAGVIALIAHRRGMEAASPGSPDPSRVAVTTAATIMTALAVVAALVHPFETLRDPIDWPENAPTRPPLAGMDTASPPPAADWMGGLGLGLASEKEVEELDGLTVTAEAEDDPLLALLQRIALGLLLLAAAVWLLRRRPWRRGDAEETVDPPVSVEAAEEGLAASLEELIGDERDPRLRITAAYFRLLSALGAAGAPREPYEAPHEHLRRALGPLGLSPEPLHRLADLHVVAHFSEREITERHRAAAVEALEASLASLRAIDGSQGGAPSSRRRPPTHAGAHG